MSAGAKVGDRLLQPLCRSPPTGVGGRLRHRELALLPAPVETAQQPDRLRGPQLGLRAVPRTPRHDGQAERAEATVGRGQQRVGRRGGPLESMGEPPQPRPAEGHVGLGEHARLGPRVERPGQGHHVVRDQRLHRIHERVVAVHAALRASAL